MKPVIIRLTNRIAGGPYKDITVTPNQFTGPTLSATSGSYSWAKNNVYIPAKSSATTFTFTKTAGSAGIAVSSNTAVATVSTSGTTVTVTPRSIGTANITVPNGSSSTTVSTFKVTVSAANLYQNQQVWYFGGLMLAPVTLNNQNPVTPWDATIINSGCPKGWHVPTVAEWQQVQSSNSYAIYNSAFSESHRGNFTQFWGPENPSNTAQAYIFYLRDRDKRVLGAYFNKTESNVFVRCGAVP